jgi:hypothetical protein
MLNYTVVTQLRSDCLTIQRKNDYNVLLYNKDIIRMLNHASLTWNT